MPTCVFRSHDDHDGNPGEGLTVGRSADGDMWLVAAIEPGRGLRFRMPFIGGGASEHTWAALGDLMDAMAADNARTPALHEKPPKGGLTAARLREVIDSPSWSTQVLAQHPDFAGVDVQAMARELLLRRQQVARLRKKTGSFS